MLKLNELFRMLGRRILYAFSISVLLTTLFAGVQISRASAQSWSFVRIFHASPNAGIVDVFMGGSKILSNFQYGTLTGYTPVVAGSHKLQIGVIGTGTNAAFLSQTLSLPANTSSTIVVLGTKSTGFSLQVFTDNNSINSNLAKARVYHLSPGTGVVNVSSDGKTFISNLSYAQASNYVSISPGSYTFNVFATQNNTNSSIPVLLKPWTVTSIFVISPIKDGSASTSQFQFVQAQITGIPGMPKTGSDPQISSTPASSPLLISWSWGLLVLLIIAVSIPLVISRQVIAKRFKSAR